ncbi:MAG: TIGR04086 family membrane protein [Clostridia bacterium]|nr:TIGR04086 family membrane protein [Clostridia bacterium]
MAKNQRSIVPAHSASLVARSREKEDASLLSTVMSSALTGTLTALALGAILLFIMTAVAYANTDPAILLSPLSLAALLPSMFAGGFVCAKKVKEAPLLCGIVCGGMITVISILLSVILRGLPSSGYEFWQTALLHAIAILFTVLGAFAGNIQRRQKPGKRRFG